MTFCTANKLSYTAIAELIKLLLLLCPLNSLIPTSLYKFKKFFQQFNPIHDHNKICLKCYPNACSCEEVSYSDTGHIVNLDIEKTLKSVISSKCMLVTNIGLMH